MHAHIFVLTIRTHAAVGHEWMMPVKIIKWWSQHACASKSLCLAHCVVGQVPVNNNIIHSSDIQTPEVGHAIPAVAPRHNVYTKKVTVTGSLRPTIGLKLQSWLAPASLAQGSPPPKQVSHWRFLRRFRAGRRCLPARFVRCIPPRQLETAYLHIPLRP